MTTNHRLLACRRAAVSLCAASLCGGVHAQPLPDPAASAVLPAASSVRPLGPGPVEAPRTEPLAAPTTIRRIDSPWHESIDAFQQADREHPPPQGGIVFVGSSTIRFWDSLETDFGGPEARIVKRGFGGSRLADCVTYLSTLVLPSHPHMVVVYAGDNDLAEGRSPQDVLDTFKAFVDGVRASLPDTRIAYVSIKPSPLRAALLPKILEANRLISAYTHVGQNLDFIDTYDAMVGADGQPRAELFRSDMLHMNEAGYAIWKTLISTHLH